MTTEAERLADELDAYGAAFDDGPGVFAEAATLLRTQAAALAEREWVEAAMREALRDMLAGWQYIRQTHGDLYGVGWDRCEIKAVAALAAAPSPNKEQS